MDKSTFSAQQWLHFEKHQEWTQLDDKSDKINCFVLCIRERILISQKKSNYLVVQIQNER